MLKSYEAIYNNGHLSWLGSKPPENNIKVIVVVEEENTKQSQHYSIKQLRGIAPKPMKVVSLEEINSAIELEGSKN